MSAEGWNLLLLIVGAVIGVGGSLATQTVGHRSQRRAEISDRQRLAAADYLGVAANALAQAIPAVAAGVQIDTSSPIRALTQAQSVLELVFPADEFQGLGRFVGAVSLIVTQAGQPVSDASPNCMLAHAAIRDIVELREQFVLGVRQIVDP